MSDTRIAPRAIDLRPVLRRMSIRELTEARDQVQEVLVDKTRARAEAGILTEDGHRLVTEDGSPMPVERG